MMRMLMTLALVAMAGEANAISRYNSTTMSCAKVQATIKRDGAAIMRHQSPRTGAPLYDRYVRNGDFCPSGQITEYQSVPASDTPNCPVLGCKYYSLDDEFLLFDR